MSSSINVTNTPDISAYMMNLIDHLNILNVVNMTQMNMFIDTAYIVLFYLHDSYY